ncbi:Galactose-binding domain-like [Phaffia rhodozyma]|uniref:Galactose-binding domain-like n=1 Tax=Phaffia rhodozyma TaxID=264483 RepID=A0A0F7ST82_PHARH|nr:Galactose-binding domain-like [Phaffia rhodozyma]
MASAKSSPAVPLITPDVVVRVSSTLDKSVSKKYLTDGDSETCWASANGLPQSITLVFPNAVIPSDLSITFAGGFVGTHCSLSYASPPGPSKTFRPWAKFYPADSNRSQSFSVGPTDEEVGLNDEVRKDGATTWKVEFEKGSDFFGRITVYEFGITGWNVVRKIRRLNDCRP